MFDYHHHNHHHHHHHHHNTAKGPLGAPLHTPNQSIRPTLVWARMSSCLRRKVPCLARL
ncbi:hypothetical protein E2C01_046112 [Portunus trituberculatus]|uniref:Uncharacterized protein n=1 Tax=Portunus trituberculatus TaxID=210409 RepID=A0A5B7G3X7_PORTR|nr:hypothetical protein [Portunus trituberculatus]